jgi:hypothetical protein
MGVFNAPAKFQKLKMGPSRQKIGLKTGDSRCHIGLFSELDQSPIVSRSLHAYLIPFTIMAAQDDLKKANDASAEGLIMTQRGRFAGLGLYLLDSQPVFHYNLCGGSPVVAISR